MRAGLPLVLPLASLVLVAAPAQAGSPVEARLRAVLTDPDAPGPIPVVRRLEVTEDRAVIGLEVPCEGPCKPLGDLPPSVENRYEAAVGALAALAPRVAQVDLLVARPGERLLPPKAVPVPHGPPPHLLNVRPDPDRFPWGQALAGRTVAISPGHGYIYYDALGGYSTQRGNIKWEGCGSCDGIVEDFGTHQLAVRYLIPLLEGAGARVVLVRERDENGVGAEVDDGNPGYAELAGTFTDGNSEGGLFGDYRVSSAPDATLQYTLQAPTTGEQLLSMWFVSGANRYEDALVEVEASQGPMHFLVDMTTHGRRWSPVTKLFLYQGEQVTLRITPPLMPVADRYLIGDAARLGAGTHSSGHAWWSMGAEPFAAFQEAPASVTQYGDVSIRPAYAEWYDADVYLALHSNASGADRSTAAGTATYRYNCGTYPDHSNDPPASACDDPTGSDRLQALVHAGLVGQLKADWDPNWVDRGTKVANFGEVRTLDDMPGVLVESAFHDNVRLADGSSLRMTDNQAMHDPRWRRAAAYGLYKGLTEFLNPGAPLVLNPPEAVAATRVSATEVEVRFAEVPGAKGYRVYLAADGRTFDAGQLVEASPARLGGLPSGAIIGVKVAAVNEAGEGRTSPLIATRASTRRAQVLVVDAHQREDAWVQEWDNRHDTALTHALALLGTEYALDGATEAALVAGLIDLTGYDALVFGLGRESTQHQILTPELRAQVAAAAAAGTAVFFGGTEIGWALDARGDAAGRAFLDDVFGAVYAADDAGAAEVKGAAGGWLAAVPAARLAGQDEDLMQTHFPDVFQLGTEGVAELTYANGSDLAGVRRGKNLLLGVALDNLVGPDARAAVLAGWLSEAVTLAPPDEMPSEDAGMPAPDAGTSPDAGAPAPDAGVAAADAGDGVRPGTEDPASGGCGCRQGPGAGPELTLGLLAALLLLARRRR
ncbi:MAG: N-acetylmuramoyl-L-alanine amidase [Deltaproteobacteria bacterium]|nr:N-acetylmuramoyl-L-alanine amidase [Deltaproteobacteria bacterium]